MRAIIRIFLTGAAALYVTTRIIPGFIISGTLLDFLLIAATFTLVQMLVKPLIHILLLPFHFVTLGTMSWIVNLLTLYALTFFIAKVRITDFDFEGVVTPILAIPPMHITAFMTAIFASMCLGLMGTFIHWLME